MYICDLVNPKTGKTWRQENEEKEHNIPIGALVEICGDDDIRNGARLFVVGHFRDCDMEPLYSLALDPGDIVPEKEGFGNPKWHNGFGESYLKVIRLPPDDTTTEKNQAG